MLAQAKDPLSKGSYAHIPPGFSDARYALAEAEGTDPADCSLFFAGEATAYHSNPQTGTHSTAHAACANQHAVHGAMESGLRAAHECVASLVQGAKL